MNIVPIYYDMIEEASKSNCSGNFIKLIFKSKNIDDNKLDANGEINICIKRNYEDVLFKFYLARKNLVSVITDTQEKFFRYMDKIERSLNDNPISIFEREELRDYSKTHHIKYEDIGIVVNRAREIIDGKILIPIITSYERKTDKVYMVEEELFGGHKAVFCFDKYEKAEYFSMIFQKVLDVINR